MTERNKAEKVFVRRLHAHTDENDETEIPMKERERKRWKRKLNWFSLLLLRNTTEWVFGVIFTEYFRLYGSLASIL